jgi:hypothetical protein
MAVISYRVDDLDGKSKVTGDATELILNGRKVTIDLSDKHVSELVALLAPYYEAGIVTEKREKVASNGNADEQDRNAEIRTWAMSNGYEVKERGRLPGNVVRAYEEWEASQESTETAAESSAA